MAEHEPPRDQPESSPSSSAGASVADGDPSPSEPSTSLVVQEEENDGLQNEQNRNNRHNHRRPRLRTLPPVLSYRVNISISNGSQTGVRDDVWSCLVVLVTFWLFASMTLILGFYGSANLQVGPNCSRLIGSNPLFVQSIKAEEVGEQKPGPALFGFYETPPMDIETTWSETHKAVIEANLHKEWAHYLNEGSKLEILYTVNSPTSSPLSLVIAQGRENLLDWIEDPSYPNSTESWNIIYGSGKIQLEISIPANYYIAVGNFNNEEAEVQLKFNIHAFLHNTSQANYRCSLGNHLCSLKLSLFGGNYVLLTSPGPEEAIPENDWYVRVSYAPRWITYFGGSGIMTVFILVIFRFFGMFHNSRVDGIDGIDGTHFQTGEVGTERSPLLGRKDDDASSWGSSYESVSHDDDEDQEEWLPVASNEGNPGNEGENNNNPRRLCVICFDSPRDCFFLPCGHCAACFTCGTRIAEEAGTCPICRRRMKKVRKIFSV